MTSILTFIEQISTGLYVVLAVGIFLTYRKFSHARLEYRMANFDLVRDIRGQSLRRISLRLATLILLAAAVAFVHLIATPYLRANPTEAVIVATPDEPEFITPTSQSPAADGVDIGDVSGRTGDEPLEAAATPTITSTPPGTMMPDAPPVEGCISPEARLEIPANGMIVLETIDVIGTAYSVNFASYKLELSGIGTTNMFAVIWESSGPVEESGVLGQLNPAGFPTGMYQFRLTVFDREGMLDDVCVVNISIGTP